MAGHIQDRWYKTETGPNVKPAKVKTDRYGSGLRYRARYVAPDGSEKSKSFPDRQKRLAEQWLAHIEADMSRGQYIDPNAGKITFKAFASDWLASQTTDAATRVAVESRLRTPSLTWAVGLWRRSSRPTYGPGRGRWRTPSRQARTAG